ncbi:FAD-dependent oxidoreductase [Nocardioides sp. PD653]|uniref:oxidoreductase n=1 Tax=Nocardioides sp. PD653 TaxID=393303 RepID=UPI0024187C98|nr:MULTISPECIES: FAD-dependent oxidoreductase [unclassified Nocardioides]
MATPIDLGPMHLKNRIAMLPHGLMWAARPDFLPNARHREYYAARARGGAALICLESSVISPDARSVHSLVHSGDPACVPGYAAIIDAVHEHGAKISGQLVHYGNEGSTSYSRAPLVGPSAVPDPVLRQQCLALDSAGMARILEQHVAAAKNFAEAGFDAIELKVAHDGLLRQFLSPLANTREDEYGGSAENRMRYILEIYRAIRAEVGDEIALSVRLDIDERVQGGWDLSDGIAFSQIFERSQLVDYISADEGIIASLDSVIAPMAFSEGYAVERTATVKAATSLPVIAFGRLTSADYAQTIVREGKADVVGFARQMLADPDFANKVLSGDGARVRPCTACNQLCLGHSERDIPVSCVVNPFAGFGEHRVRRSSVGKRLVVVGGGPAGLEAARVKAEDGYDVTLLEKNGTLGGALALAASVGGRSGWQPYLHWLEREVARLGVEVKLNTEADAELVASLEPDLVVIAAGAASFSPDVGSGLPVFTVEDFAAGAPVEGRVAVVDQGYPSVALWFSALEAFARGAREVVVVTPEPMFGSRLDSATRLKLNRDLAPHPVRVLPDHRLIEVTQEGIVVQSVFGPHTTELGVDAVLISTERQSEGGALVEQLRSRGYRTMVVGDALVPRDAAAAILEGSGI